MTKSAMAGFALACALPALASATGLQGSWTATKAEREGDAADDIVGHQLSFAGDSFQVRSKHGTLIYAGTVRVDPRASPAAIDFMHQDGVLKGRVWKGIYVLDGTKLTICDNAANLEKGRPVAFEAKAMSGHVLVTFKRATR
jgi:uncharacterized protein (TIGR03067 family)